MAEKRVKCKSVVLLASLESGIPGPEHFRIDETEVCVDKPKEGEVVVQVLCMSADPYLRGRIKAADGGSKDKIRGGDVMAGFVSGRVIASSNDKWTVGDLFGAHLPFSTVQIVHNVDTTLMWKLTDLITEDHISYGVGILGMPGATAYGGLVDILRPLKGETIFISASSGAVGGLVGQMAKNIFECRVVGSCGGDRKCNLVKHVYGYDAVVDYKQVANTKELVAKLNELTPSGIDMYFENVGGMHFEAAMEVLRERGRVAVCGQISEYNKETPDLCAFNPMKMIYSNQRIEGFISTRWLSGKEGHFLRDMHQWLTEGKVKPEETFFAGIEEWPNAFQALFTGTNVGKVVVRIEEIQV